MKIFRSRYQTLAKGDPNSNTVYSEGEQAYALGLGEICPEVLKFKIEPRPVGFYSKI